MRPPHHLKVDPLKPHTAESWLEMATPAVILRKRRNQPFRRKYPAVRGINGLLPPGLDLSDYLWRERRCPHRPPRLRRVNRSLVDTLDDLRGIALHLFPFQSEDFTGPHAGEDGEPRNEPLP